MKFMIPLLIAVLSALSFAQSQSEAGQGRNRSTSAFAIAARIPLPNFPVEIELYSRLNLVRNHSPDGNAAAREGTFDGSRVHSRRAADAAESAEPSCIPVTPRNGAAARGTIGVLSPFLIRD
jgi:hypothetical protein